MPELRQNRFTKEWVIIATERAKRPKDMVVLRAPRNLPSFDPKCPFCPGNEKTCASCPTSSPRYNRT